MTTKISKKGLELIVHGEFEEVGTVFSLNAGLPVQIRYASELFSLAKPLTVREHTYVKSIANHNNQVYTTGNNVCESVVYNPKTEEVILIKQSSLITNAQSFIQEVVARERGRNSEKEYRDWQELKRRAIGQEKLRPHQRSHHLVRNMRLYTELKGQPVTSIEQDAENPEISFLYGMPPEALSKMLRQQGFNHSIDFELFDSNGCKFNRERQYNQNAPLFDLKEYSFPFLRNLWIMGHTKDYISIHPIDTKGHDSALNCFYWKTRLNSDELVRAVKEFNGEKIKDSIQSSNDVERLLWVIPTMFGRTIDIQRLLDLPESIRREFSKFGTHQRVSFYQGGERPELQDYHARYYFGQKGMDPRKKLIQPDDLTLPTNDPQEVPSTGDILITLPQGLVYLGGDAKYSRWHRKLYRSEFLKVRRTYKHWK
jgi:hypothetical protein